MTKTSLSFLALSFFFFLEINTALAEDVERKRPDNWEKLIFGGRFMDRLLPMPEIGKTSSDTWGVDKVKPRYIENGIEAKEWSYWGGNILVDEQGKYNLFTCRWSEDSPKGHMAWPDSVVVHAVSDNAAGPYKVTNVVGEGHNPEIHQLNDGTYFLYAAVNFGQTYYESKSLNGPWELKQMHYDVRQRQIVDHMANNTFCKREDGSMLMVGRGGGIWISQDGHPPYKQITANSVYPAYEGEYEDPVVWKTDVQYHLIVNDWLGRIAYYMRSKDGIHWKVDEGEAYLPGIAKHKDGTVEDWYKFERIKVLQDQYGRVYQTNFAVCDTVKRSDLPNDNHSSKNICIPTTVGRLIEILNKEKINSTTKEIKVLIKAEPGFNPHQDIDIQSLRFGASEEVDYGKGSSTISSEKQGNHLLVTFSGEGNGLTNNNFAAKLLGKRKDGELLFGFCRLPWLNYEPTVLSSLYPEMFYNGRTLYADIEVENFGIATSKKAQCLLEYQNADQWLTFGKSEIPTLQPYQKTKLRFHLKKQIQERGNPVNVRVTISQANEPDAVLEGPVIIR